MKPSGRIAAVVLHYRNWPAVRASLDSLLFQDLTVDKLVVVDNHSGNSGPGSIAKAYPEIEMLIPAANLGYAAGMNLGIKSALEQNPDFILLMTHDCVLQPGCLNRLAGRMADKPTLGAVGPLLVYRSDPTKVWSAGGMVKRGTRLTDHWGSGDPFAAWAHRPPRKVEWLDGACLMLRSEALEETGRFNERYFMYYEEAEYLVRMARRGWGVECLPAASAAQEPSSIAAYLRTRNSLGFVSATAPGRFLAREILHQMSTMAVDLLHPAAPEHRTTVVPRLLGLIDFTLGRWGPPDGKRRAG